jgi:hypothetical protein
MTSRQDLKKLAVDAVLTIAGDLQEGRIDVTQLDAETLAEGRKLFGTVVGPDNPLWPLQVDVARQCVSIGALSVDELAEWVAVFRARDPQPATAGGSWIERALAEGDADDDDV